MRLKSVRRRQLLSSLRLRRERGQSTTEYVLILAMLVLPIATAFNQFRSVLRAVLSAFCSLLEGPGL